MRDLPANIETQINTSLASLVICWKITKKDGDVLRGTEHDRNITIDSGDFAGEYLSEFNISGSDLKTSSDLSVDNLEVDGATDQIAGITMRVVDIESGILDNASVIVFLVDWTDPNAGQHITKAGYVGSISRDSDTRYKAEVRGLRQKLSQQIGQNYSENCNVVRFGDERCKFDVASITQACVVTSVTDRKNFTADIVDPSAAVLPTSLPRGGEVQWTSGANIDFEREVKDMSLNSYTFTIELYEESPDDIQVGDTVDIIPGCDRQASTCRYVYDNLDNFRGYGIFVPGVMAIQRGNSLAECVVPTISPPGTVPGGDGGTDDPGGVGGGGGGDPPDPPPITPPGDDPLPTDDPPVMPPPAPDGRNILWDGSLTSGRIGPGTWLGDGYIGCKCEPEGGVDNWAATKNGDPRITAGSVSTTLDQHVTSGETFDGVSIVPRFPSSYFLRQALYYSKQYEIVNNSHDPDLAKDKVRCYWTPNENQTGHDYDREVWLGLSRYLHPHNSHDLDAPRTHQGGPTLATIEATDNFSQFKIYLAKPPLSATSGYDGPVGGSHQHWMLWWTLNPNSPNQPAHEFGSPGSFVVSLGDADDDFGFWTDFVIRYRINPFSVDTNAATKGGRNHVYEGNKGILQVWKSTGPYLDANRNRAMTLKFSRYNQPVGCVPHATLRICGNRGGVYHYGWKHNATSSTAPRYYGIAQHRWGFRKPPEANEIFTQHGTKDIDVNPSGGALSGWSEQDGYVDPTPPPDTGDNGALKVYAAVTGKSSPDYTVTVSQGGTPLSSPVLYSTNPMFYLIDGSPTDLTKFRHWTQFERDVADGAVTVVVHLPGASVAGAEVRSGHGGNWGPTAVPVPSTIDTGAHTITFDIDEIGQYMVYVPSMKKQVGVAESGDPLFIFMSDLDTNIPVAGANVVLFDPGGPYTVPAGTTKVRFKPGIHNVDPLFGTTGHLTPADFQTQYGREIYIDGGAWVNGMINGQAAGSGELLIRGKGTLSGEKYISNGVPENTAYKMIEVASRAGGTVRVEGITITDAPSKNFIVNDDTFELYDLKFMGVTGDGPTMENGATADLCFTMLNDDHYKFFHGGARITRATAFLHKVGPLVQTCWNLTADTSDVELDGFCIVGADRPDAPAPGDWTNNINNAIISCGNINGATLTDYRFKNGSSFVEVWQIIGLHTKGTIPGFTSGLGDIDGWLFQNISVPSVTTFSHFDAIGASTGRITGITLDTVKVGGTKITDANKASYLKFSGTDDSATFIYA